MDTYSLGQIDRKLLDGIPASLLARLNDLARARTASKSLAEMAFDCTRGGTANTYRPTIRTSVFKKHPTQQEIREAAENMYLADGFDAAMELLGETKRAFRG